MSPMPTVARLAHRSTQFDNASRANGVLTGGGWLPQAAALNVTSNQFAGSQSGTSGNYRTGAFRNDQWAQAVIPAGINTGDYIGLTLRTQGTSGNTWYGALYWNNSGTYVISMWYSLTGSTTNIGTYTIGTTALTAGTVFKFTIEGARIRAWLNGAVVFETGDFNIRSGGTPGITAFGTSGRFDNFSCGSTVKVPTAYANAGTFYSTPTRTATEAGGVQDWSFDTTNNPQAGHSPAPQSSGGGQLRILPPPSPAAVPHNFLIICTVEPGFHGTTYGNGLDAISATGVHNTWNLTLVETCWGTNGWLGDSPSDPTQHCESNLCADLIPWLRNSQFASGGEQFWHIGFSRSGLGGLTQIFKHPWLYQKAAVWDFPFDMWDYASEGAGGSTGPFGTQDNFNQNYALTYQFFEELMAPFLVNTRIWTGGYSAFQTDSSTIRTMFAAKGIQYTAGALVNSSSHNWAPSPTGAWVANAINAMGAMTAAAPTNSVAPTLSGTVAVGSVQTCSPGTWSDPTCQFFYQWQTDSASPGTYAVVSTGVNGNQYTIQAGDGGNHVRCLVNAVSVNGGTNALATAAVVPPGAPANTVAPVISGTTTVGSTLTCSQGTWANSPTGFTYQWQQNGVNISGQTANTYVVASGDLGTTIGCVVTATNSFGSRSATATIAIPPGPPVNTVLPVISGSTSVGSTLTCTTGTWTNSPSSYTYQWQRDAVNISGATSAGYVIVSGDQGHVIACRVVATNVAGNAGATASGITIPASPINTVLPAITGATTLAATLTCSQGTWSNSPTSYAYQWTRDGTNISGATASTYVITTSDQGHSLACVVTASNASGSTPATASSVAIPGSALPELVLTQVQTDNFTRANGNVGGSNGWTQNAQGDTNLVINSNAVFNVGTPDGGVYRTGETYNSDQYSEVTIGNNASGGLTGPSVRNTSGGQAYLLGYYQNAPGTYQFLLVKRSNSAGGNYATLCGTTSFSGGILQPGDKVRIVAEGNQITCFVIPLANGGVWGQGNVGQAGVPYAFLSIYDGNNIGSSPALTGGSPGIAMGGSTAGPSVTAWAGGNAATTALSAALQTDNFNRANAGASVGQSGWQIMTGYPAGDPPIVSNQLSIPSNLVVSGSSFHHAAIVRTETYNNDHWAQAALGTAGMVGSNQGDFLGLLTRVNSGLNSGYLLCAFHNGNTIDGNYSYSIYRLDNGASTLIGGCPASDQTHNPSEPPGTSFTGISIGNRHSILVGGHEVCWCFDSTYTSGKPGMMHYPPVSSSNNLLVDNFACGNV